MCNYDTEKTKEFRERKLLDAINDVQISLSQAIELLVMASLYQDISNTTIVNLRHYVEAIYQLKISFVDGVFCIKIPAELMKFGKKSVKTDFNKEDKSIGIILNELSRIETFFNEKVSAIEAKRPDLKDQAFIKQENVFRNLKNAFVEYSN